MAKKILLADDSITIQKVVELTFSDGDYEVVAVNNGAKAIQKLQESRPDVILSDIIMPEKNGYEVCEFVKSHPEFRNIPVILLTGTFEPFDPDRAERAGCDAVVTKPFESQSLIHKVEELIQQFGAAAAQAPPVPDSSPFEETKAERRPAPPPEQTPAETAPFEQGDRPSPEEIFGVSEPVSEPSEAAPAGFSDASDELFEGGETSAPAEDRAASAAEPEKPDAQRSWSAETTAFPKMSFEDLQKLRDERAPEPEQEEQPAEPEQVQTGSDATGASQSSFDEQRNEGFELAPPPAAAAEEKKEEPEQEERWSADTTAFPKMSFDDISKAKEPESARGARTFPWESAPEEPESEGLEWPQAQAPAPEQQDEDFPTAGDRPSGFGFETPSETPETTPSTPPTSFEASAETSAADETGEDRWTVPTSAEPPTGAREESEQEAPAVGGLPPSAPEEQPVRAADSPAGAAELESSRPAASAGRMADEDVDRIARRVVEMLSDKAVRDIAWEVIPDLAEAIVRDRIRQLEGQD